MTNRMKVEFDSISANEAFARVTVAAFLTQLNPSVEEVADVKTAVSEAVTNAIIHGYQGEVHTCLLYTSSPQKHQRGDSQQHAAHLGNQLYRRHIQTYHVQRVGNQMQILSSKRRDAAAQDRSCLLYTSRCV